MKTTLLFMALTLGSLGSCNPAEEDSRSGSTQQPGENNGNGNGSGNTSGNGSDHQTDETMKIQLTIGAEVFRATLADTPAARAFRDMLPLVLDMRDVNGNEKYFELDRSLPTDSSSPGTVRTGDLMLWGSGGIVLFYKTFATPYSYTALGSVDDPSGLEAALGGGSVRVIFQSGGEE